MPALEFSASTGKLVITMITTGRRSSIDVFIGVVLVLAWVWTAKFDKTNSGRMTCLLLASARRARVPSDSVCQHCSIMLLHRERGMAALGKSVISTLGFRAPFSSPPDLLHHRWCPTSYKLMERLNGLAIVYVVSLHLPSFTTCVHLVAVPRHDASGYG